MSDKRTRAKLFHLFRHFSSVISTMFFSPQQQEIDHLFMQQFQLVFGQVMGTHYNALIGFLVVFSLFVCLFRDS